MNPAEFDNIARTERSFWWYRGMREILYQALKGIAAPRGSDVLEAGCGTGYMSKALADRYGWRMTPLDLGREGLEYARGYGLDRLVQGSIMALPFRAGVFDALVSFDVLVHLPRGEEGIALKEFARVLKPGALLVVRVAALEILRSRHSEFVEERQRFTRGRLKQFAAEAGFDIVRSTYLNSLLLPAALLKFRVWEPLTGAAVSSGVTGEPGWLEWMFYAAMRVEAAWIGLGGNFPLGQSLLLIAKRR